MHTTTWMKCENMLSEKKPDKGPHIVWFYLYKMTRAGKSIETESRWMVVRTGGKWGVTANGYQISFWGDEIALKLIVVMVV